MVAWAQPEVCVTFATQVIFLAFSLFRFFADSLTADR